MPYTPHDWAPLQPILEEILAEQAVGISEFELFNVLKSAPYSLFTEQALQNPLSLFQSHFVLFNALYQLKDRWLQNKQADMHIHCTSIRKLPWEPGESAVVTENKLRAYYLDWTNLNNTNQGEVEAMLDNFWQALSGVTNNHPLNVMETQEALDILELSQPFSAKQLKQQYRKMLHQLHPDKGGNHLQTVALHQAYQQLNQHG